MRVLSAVASARSAAIYLVLGVALAAYALLALPAEGADHKDGPMATGDPKSDIADVYAFRSPENNDNLVVVVTLAGLTAPAQIDQMAPDPGVTATINVDRNGDLTPEAQATVSVSGGNFSISGLTAQPITGAITPLNSDQPMVTTSGPIKAFAGVRDDPFFFDLTGVKAFIANPQKPASGVRPAGQTPSDTFAGTNAVAVVLEAPITAITGASSANTGTIKAWVTTQRGQTRADRMAIPGLNTFLIPDNQKDNYNKGNPSTDVAQFAPVMTQQLTALRAAVLPVLGAEDGGPLGNLTVAQVIGALQPDVVTIDFSKPVQFPNGRRLQDDVGDIALGLLLNRGGANGIADGVNANDKAFSNTFPYLAAPSRAAATQATATATPATGGAQATATAPASTAAAGTSGAGAVAPPRTGTGGLVDDGSGWQLPLLGLSAVLVVLGGGMMLRRRMAR